MKTINKTMAQVVMYISIGCLSSLITYNQALADESTGENLANPSSIEEGNSSQQAEILQLNKEANTAKIKSDIYKEITLEFTQQVAELTRQVLDSKNKTISYQNN